MVTGLGIVGIGIGVLSAVAAVVAFFRANMGRATIELWRLDNEALRGRVSTLESELAIEQKRSATQAARITTMEEERAVMRDLVSGASAVHALSEVIEAQHQQVIERLDAMLLRIKAGRND